MRTALRGRGTRSNDDRHDGRHEPDGDWYDGLRHRGDDTEPVHRRLRAEPRPLG